MTGSSIGTRLVIIVSLMIGGVGLAAPAQAKAAATRAAAAKKAATVDWVNAKLTLPWTAARLQDGTSCPSGRLQFVGLGPASPTTGSAGRDGLTYYLQVVATADVTGDGRADTVIRLTCADDQNDENRMSWLYLYTVKRNKPVLLDFITASDAQVNAEYGVLTVQARPGAIDVTEFVRTLPDLIPRTFSWDCHRLTVDQPLPLHPEADIAP